MVTKTFDLNSRDPNLQLTAPSRMTVCNFCTLNKVLLKYIKTAGIYKE